MQSTQRHASRGPYFNRLRRFAGLAGRSWRRFRSFLSVNPVRRHWRALSRSQSLFLSNVGIAVLIAVVIAFFHQHHWLVRLENSAMDTMMEFNQGLPRMSDAGSADPMQFTFLDIDDASYRGWGEPYHVPRDKILKLIKFAAEANARLIVLDIDLSREGVDADDDRRLAAYLTQYGKGVAHPPLILVRTFYSGEPGDRQWVDIRPSFLDEFEFPTSVHWAQPLFKATLWDGVIRHWHLIKFGCLNGRLVLVPATQLIAAALLSAGDVSSVNRYADLNVVRMENCNNADSAASAITFRDAGGRSEIFSPEAELGQRLIYTIPWKSPAPDLITVPAQLITESPHDLSGDLIRNRVVIIGASFADSRDIHRTPIGEMPGALIIANAIKSLTHYGQVRPPPALSHWVEKLFLILVAAWAFSRLTSLIAVFVAGAIIIGALVPISFYFFKYGLWVDFAIPLLAMVIHRAVAEYRGVQSLPHTIDGQGRKT